MLTRNLSLRPVFHALLPGAFLLLFPIAALGADNGAAATTAAGADQEFAAEKKVESFEVSRKFVGGPVREKDDAAQRTAAEASVSARSERMGESPVNLYFLPRDEFEEVVRRPEDSFAEKMNRAAEDMPAKTERELARSTTHTRKLSRGLSNVFLGWMEIPRQYCKAIREDDLDPITSFAVGGLRGVAFTFTRMGVGVFEIFTFYKPKPGHYGVIIKPEFIMTDMWGEPIPIIADRNNNAWEGVESPGIPEAWGK